MKRTCLVFLAVLVSAAGMFAQVSSAEPPALSVWNIHTRDVITARDVQNNPIAVFTPTKPIIVRRVEALSMRGPVIAAVSSPEPTQCPLKFSLEITNGTVSQTVPISSVFLKKGSEQTYTDSGSLSVPFSDGSRIAVVLVVPATGFPPTSCVINGLNISIQFESGDAAPGKAK
jgi:hypothetical protein